MCVLRSVRAVLSAGSLAGRPRMREPVARVTMSGWTTPLSPLWLVGSDDGGCRTCKGLPLATCFTGVCPRTRGAPALPPWRAPCRRLSSGGLRLEPSPVHFWGGNWTGVRTHSHIKLSMVLGVTFAAHPLGSLQVSGERVAAPTVPDVRNCRIGFFRHRASLRDDTPRDREPGPAGDSGLGAAGTAPTAWRHDGNAGSAISATPAPPHPVSGGAPGRCPCSQSRPPGPAVGNCGAAAATPRAGDGCADTPGPFVWALVRHGLREEWVQRPVHVQHGPRR